MPEITMPKMSDTMEEGKVIRWLKHAGDQVPEGEPIAVEPPAEPQPDAVEDPEAVEDPGAAAAAGGAATVQRPGGQVRGPELGRRARGSPRNGPPHPRRP